jgi:hypothetical protein
MEKDHLKILPENIKVKFMLILEGYSVFLEIMPIQAMRGCHADFEE